MEFNKSKVLLISFLSMVFLYVAMEVAHLATSDYKFVYSGYGVLKRAALGSLVLFSVLGQYESYKREIKLSIAILALILIMFNAWWAVDYFNQSFMDSFYFAIVDLLFMLCVLGYLYKEIVCSYFSKASSVRVCLYVFLSLFSVVLIKESYILVRDALYVVEFYQNAGGYQDVDHAFTPLMNAKYTCAYLLDIAFVLIFLVAVARDLGWTFILNMLERSVTKPNVETMEKADGKTVGYKNKIVIIALLLIIASSFLPFFSLSLLGFKGATVGHEVTGFGYTLLFSIILGANLIAREKLTLTITNWFSLMVLLILAYDVNSALSEQGVDMLTKEYGLIVLALGSVAKIVGVLKGPSSYSTRQPQLAVSSEEGS